jgi:hypothetical protein
LKIRISYDIIYVLLIIIIFLSGELISPSVSFSACFLLMLILIIKFRYINRKEISIIAPLLLIMLIGIISAFVNDRAVISDKMYLFGKDIWYYTKPVIYLITGFYLFRMKLRKGVFFRILLNLSLFIAVVHIIRVALFIYNADPQSLILDTIRAKTGPGNIMVAFSLAYVLSSLRSSETRDYIMIPLWLSILILSTSLILSFSRTLLMGLIISFLALKGFFSFRLNKFLKSIFITIFILLTGLLALLATRRFSDKDTVLHALSVKYLNSLNEVTYQDNYYTFEEINSDWRGLETHITKTEIQKGNIYERIFGFGFGKTVFIGYNGILGPENIYIPKFHNGFIEIILKTGYAGLIIYILFFYFSFSVADRHNPGAETDRFLKALLVTAFFSTFFITGLYNKSIFDPVCLSIGYLLGFSWSERTS